MMGILIQHLGPDDVAAAEYILENLMEAGAERPSRERLLRLLGDRRTYLCAAVEGDEVIGYALAYRFPSMYGDGDLAYLYDIEVVEAHRRKGAGRLLMEAIKDLLRADGADELWLGTATDNDEAQALFAATGGQRSGEVFHDITFYLD